MRKCIWGRLLIACRGRGLTSFSPLIHKKHYENVLNYIEIGKQEGGLLLCGGMPKGREDFTSDEEISKSAMMEKGCFVLPTVFANCKDSHRIVREEIFGPVCCLLKFSGEEEVVRRANDTVFGLAGGVFTKDVNRALRISKQLNVGQMWVNCFNTSPVEFPWGGMKKSGMGRENGTEVCRLIVCM